MMHHLLTSSFKMEENENTVLNNLYHPTKSNILDSDFSKWYFIRFIFICFDVEYSIQNVYMRLKFLTATQNRDAII